MKYLSVWIRGILAGIAIGLGGTVYLLLDNRFLGAAMFTVGLFTVCTRGFALFTGRVCYALEKDRSYLLELPVIWLGNFVGAWLLAQVESVTRTGPQLMEKAISVCQVKLSDNLLSIFVLAALCNVMIFIAVDGYAKNPHETGKYLALFFGVMVFILCGFEHCVANMYYFSMAHVWNGSTLLYLLVMTAGNTIGGLLIPVLQSLV
ncbi:MAG: formate/nitrite transporter family protein [Clostridia bacterium]|nr:formate/nitrite transporter family protein [Clostridia bacterium]